MACSVIRYPLLRNSAVRHYAAAAAVKCPATNKNEAAKVLENKVTVAAVNEDDPISQVSILFKAGPRNETYDTQGISHYLRICAGLTTECSSTFAITRNIQQLGGELTCSSDREYISYNLKITKNNVSPALKFLEDIATGQLFRPWEISDEIPRLRYEVSILPGNVRLIELLYKAAYREGLGYSLYCPKRQIGKISTETLSHFVSNYFTGSRCAVVGSGIPQADLEEFASNLDLSNQNCIDIPSKYQGGEIRKERNSQLTTVAVAVEGGNFKDRKEAIIFALLQKIGGDGPFVKWGNNHSPLHKCVAAKAGEELFAVSSFNASHTDGGLFGYILSAGSTIAGELIMSATSWLQAPQYTENDIEMAKMKLKVALFTADDSDYAYHDNIGEQLLFSGKVKSISSIVDQIDKISVDDIKKVAARFSKGKISMSSIGNLETVPYINQF